MPLLRVPSHLSNSLLRFVTAVLLFTSATLLPANTPQDQPHKFQSPLPLEFEPNMGQVDPPVRFVSRAPGFNLFLLPAKVVLTLQHSEPRQKSLKPRSRLPESRALTLQLAGASRNARVSGIMRQPGVSHYLFGSDRSSWHTNIPHFKKVRYTGIYPGIDLVFYGNGRQLEFDFVVHPGSDSRKIAFDISGADRIHTSEAGDLVLNIGAADSQLHLPDVYQLREGKKTKIPGRYRLIGTRVAFDVGAYDRRRELVIDPVLAYSTYLGGSGDDNFVTGGIAVDSAGHAFIAGSTESLNFPTTTGAYDRSCGTDGKCNATSDAFVTKLNTTGTGLIYSTFIGGSGRDFAFDIKVDSTGHAYVTGSTESINFPGTRISPLVIGNTETYVLKLNAAGSGLLYGVKFGGNGFGSSGRAIAIDSSGHAYITGVGTIGFPTTPGAFQETTDRGGAFVSKLNAAGTGFLYSTLVDGPGDEQGTAIAVDKSGNAYVGGFVEFGDFITTPGSFQPHNPHPNNNQTTGIVFKLNSTGSGLLYSTHLGGTFEESIFGLAIDSSGHAFVTGFTVSSDFPTTAGAFRRAFQEEEAFVTKLNAAGTGLLYSTFIGGSSFDAGGDVAVDSSGNAYVAGFTVSPNFPTTTTAFQRVENGGFDQFVSKLNAAGSGLIYSSLLGGTGDDISFPAIALDSSNNVYIVGQTGATDFPVTPDAFQRKFAGGFRDSFVVKVVPLCALTSLATICSPQDGATVRSPMKLMAGTRDVTPVRLIQVYIDGQKAYQARLSAIDVRLPLSLGPHRVTVQAYDTANIVFKKTINVTVIP